jgi:Halobacterial output domain 1
MSVEDQEDTVPFLCGVETPVEIQYDWRNDQPLSTTLVQTMVEAAGIDPKDIPEPFYDSIDPEALEDLFRPQIDGTPRVNGRAIFVFAGHYITVQADGQITIESELGRLKRTGGNILLTGDVPEEVFDQMSVQLLGDDAFDRTFLFAQYGEDAEVAQTRLSMADAPPNRAHILTHETVARSTVAAQASQATRMSVSSVTGNLQDFQTAIREQIFDLQRQWNGFDPAELRFCFDSLRLLLEEEDPETVEQFITAVTETVEEFDGLGHYIMQDSYDSHPVQAVRSTFDVIIELSFDVNGPKQRWHLQNTDHTTKWFPL